MFPTLKGKGNVIDSARALRPDSCLLITDPLRKIFEARSLDFLFFTKAPDHYAKMRKLFFFKLITADWMKTKHVSVRGSHQT